MKRWPLLVGITYYSPIPINQWSPLDDPHDDVDRYRELLTNASSHGASSNLILQRRSLSQLHLMILLFYCLA